MSDSSGPRASTDPEWMQSTHTSIYPSVDPTSPSLSLAQKVIILTGIARVNETQVGVSAIVHSGILPALVKARPRGLVLVTRDPEILSDAVQEIERTDPSIETLAVPTDISSATSVCQLMASVQDRFGHADVLINAANPEDALGPVVIVKPETWWKEFETNAAGPCHITQAFIDQLPESFHGTIINLTVGSGYGLSFRNPGRRFAKRLSRQLRGYEPLLGKSITSVSLYPDQMSTTHVPENSETENVLNLIGGTAVWLCSQTSQWLHGQWISAIWDVDKLCDHETDIIEQRLLKIGEG